MLVENALNFLFPPKCVICGKRGEYICDKCLRALGETKINTQYFKNKNLSSLIFLFKYEKIIRKLILQFKFFDKPYISKIFVKIISKNEKLCRKIKFYDIIIPVPMYEKKKRLRGYNQTELLAERNSQNYRN